MTFYDYLKNILLILILLQFAPSLVENIKKQYGRYLEPQTPVAVIPIKGILYDSSSYVRQLHKYFKEPKIKAILLKMECAGSTSGTGEAIYNEIMELKKEYPKPVVVLVENVCASGGYLIACAADHIVAPSMATIGSIGNYLPFLFQLREFLQDYKIRYISIKGGKYKTTGDPFVDMTSEEQALLQSMAHDAYDQFVHIVAKARKLSITATLERAEGKIFTGNQALKLGLIDEVGSAYNAIKVIKNKAMIEGEIEWVKEHQPTSLLSSLLGGSSPTDNDSSFLSCMVNSICTTLETRYTSAKMY
ncbi:MAG: signal peptide peptidase SppA [bacterium]|nr:signal peptide peptidase SppA [bacterium]